MKDGDPIPAEGQAATLVHRWHSHGATVIDADEWRILVQRDRAVLGVDQKYTFEPNPHGGYTTFTRRPSGVFAEASYRVGEGCDLVLGERSERLTIQVTRRADDFHASVHGLPGQEVCGSSMDAVILELRGRVPELEVALIRFRVWG